MRPDSLSRWTDQFNLTKGTEPPVINDSTEQNEGWVRSLLQSSKQAEKDKYIRFFVTGEIGTGKSTFFKRTIRKNQKLFLESKIIPARIEFSKISRSSPSDETRKLEMLRRAIIDSFYREIHHLFSDEVRKTSFFENGEFEKFRRYIIDRKLYIGDGQNFENRQKAAEDFADFQIAKAKRFITLSREDRKMEVRNSDDTFKELTIHYVTQHLGYSFVSIFDGFDYITAADYLYSTSNSEQIASLNSVYKGSSKFPLLDRIGSHLDFHQVFVMRDVTYARFFERNPGLDEIDNRKHFRIIGPSSKALVARAIARVCDENNLPDVSADLFEFDRFMRKTIREVIIKGDTEATSEGNNENEKSNPLVPLNLFNGNARKELNFLKLIIEFIVLEIIADPKNSYTDSVENLFSVAGDPEFRRRIRQKQYRLLGILLCQNRSTFRNSIALPADGEMGPNGIMDLEGVGNYIDNVYNYDEKNQAPLGLLSKIRICELVRRIPLTAVEIASKLGQSYSTDYDRTLAVMCRTGLLKTRFKNGSVFFQAEPLGMLCIDHLCHKTEYIEHVFPHIALPSHVRDPSIRAYERDRTSPRYWARASLVNSFLLLQHVRQIEKLERKEGYSWKWLAPQIETHHADTLARTVRKFFNPNINRTILDEFESDLNKVYSI